MRVAIDQFIPQSFTGPAEMQIDNVKLLADRSLIITVQNSVPVLDVGQDEAHH